MSLLYADENFPLKVTLALRQLGHDVLTALEAGQANQRIEDQDVLIFATKEGRAVLTINRRDFLRLHQQHPEHYGIIVCTIDSDIDGQAERIHTAITAKGSLKNTVIRINRPLQ